MQCACEGLTFDNTELHEFAYAVFANLAKVMEAEFSPCLEELVPHLLAVLEEDDGCLEKQVETQVRLKLIQSLIFVTSSQIANIN
jgi:hypothetical protein